MSVRLKDVAQRANVSISTVSRVINNDKAKPVKKETADRIWQIVNEMGYVPNQEARNLIKKESNIGIQTKHKTVGCIYTSTKDCHHDPFFSHLASGIKDELDRQDYILNYSYSVQGMDFSSIYNYLVSRPVEGIVVMGLFSQEILTYIKTNFENVVYAGVNYVGEGFDEVICDGYKGSMEAVEYLINGGHTRIGFIGNSSTNESKRLVNEHRFDAFVDTLKKYNLAIDNRCIINTEPYTPLAYEATKTYLQSVPHGDRPSAFYCANDATAIGAVKAMSEEGVAIPAEISIVGFDDVEMAAFIHPSLTTVRVPKEDLGRMAVKLLIDRIESGRDYPVRMDIPYELVIRESSADYRRN